MRVGKAQLQARNGMVEVQEFVEVFHTKWPLRGLDNVLGMTMVSLASFFFFFSFSFQMFYMFHFSNLDDTSIFFP